MPSLGANGIASALGPIQINHPRGSTAIIPGCELLVRLGSAMDAGWTSATPTTPTAMRAAMSAEFSDWSRGYGQAMMEAIGTGIDTDVGLWVASWDAVTRTHLYAPSAGAIYSYIMAAMPIDTAATRAIAQKCANVFMQGFGQEAG